MLIWTGSLKRDPIALTMLDRDGIINQDRPDYVKRWEEVRLYPDALEALRYLREHSIDVILVSNQSGLNRGIIAWDDFWELHERMVAAIRCEGGDLTAALFCPHRPDEGCLCRKPRPGMVQTAVRLFGGAHERRFMIGDRWTDVEAGIRGGCRAMLVEREGAPASLSGGGGVKEHIPTYRTLLEAVMALPVPMPRTKFA